MKALPTMFIGIFGLLFTGIAMLYATGRFGKDAGTYEVALLLHADVQKIITAMTMPASRVKWNKDLKSSELLPSSNTARYEFSEWVAIRNNDSYAQKTQISITFPTTNEKRTILYLHRYLPIPERKDYFVDETWLFENFSNGTGVFVSNQTHYDLWITRLMEPLVTPKNQKKKIEELETLKALLEGN
jgi:hypothetical protein